MLLDRSLRQLSQDLRKKTLSSEDLVREALATIERFNSTLHSFITTKDSELALREARQLDKTRSSKSSLVHGIPFSLKDAYCTDDMITTAGSRVLDGFVPPYNATVYEKLKKAGALLIGKNNQDAWGHGGSTENTDYTPARNPWDTKRIAGGSSGGSAIAVAARMAGFAIGEDTGGSIRNPSSMCNTTGLKVTYGRVSRYGAIAYASSLDTVGPMAKSVEDIAFLLEIMAGFDPADSTSSRRPVEKYSQFLDQDIRGKVIGLPKEFFGEGLDPEVKALILAAAKQFEQLGAKVTEVSIPLLKQSISIYYLTALSETSSNLARYDGVRFGTDRKEFTQETARRIMVGSFALSAGHSDELYASAQQARAALIQESNEVFKHCDALLTPVTPSPPHVVGELLNDPLKNLLEDLYTVAVNVIGVPSLSLPAGFTNNKLPVGMQLIGKKFSEGELLQLGSAYQSTTQWHVQKPPILV